jgi:hypothetical protein
LTYESNSNIDIRLSADADSATGYRVNSERGMNVRRRCAIKLSARHRCCASHGIDDGELRKAFGALVERWAAVSSAPGAR